MNGGCDFLTYCISVYFSGTFKHIPSDDLKMAAAGVSKIISCSGRLPEKSDDILEMKTRTGS